jgi:hypothetical protein
MRFHEFMQVLVKQTYVWQMARGRDPERNRSAATRLANAQRRIDDAVLARALTIADERRCAVRYQVGTAAPIQRGMPEEPLYVRCEYAAGHGRVPGHSDRARARVEAQEYDHGAPSAKVWWNNEEQGD